MRWLFRQFEKKNHKIEIKNVLHLSHIIWHDQMVDAIKITYRVLSPCLIGMSILSEKNPSFNCVTSLHENTDHSQMCFVHFFFFYCLYLVQKCYGNLPTYYFNRNTCTPANVFMHLSNCMWQQ